MAPLQKIWLWYWNQGLILVANSFAIERTQRPYKRLSATIMLGLSNDITLLVDGETTLQTRAILLGPGLARRCLSAQNADIVILDIPVSSPEFLRLRPLIKSNSYLLLDLDLFGSIRERLLPLTVGQADSREVVGISKDLIDVITGAYPGLMSNYSAVVVNVLNTIDKTPHDEISIGLLANNVNLSESRLRAIFRNELGCSISQYMRCSAVWKAVSAWAKNRRFIDVAADAGFYDLAHLNKAFNEVFGVNPRDAFQSVNFEPSRLIPLDSPPKIGHGNLGFK